MPPSPQSRGFARTELRHQKFVMTHWVLSTLLIKIVLRTKVIKCFLFVALSERVSFPFRKIKFKCYTTTSCSRELLFVFSQVWLAYFAI